MRLLLSTLILAFLIAPSHAAPNGYGCKEEAELLATKAAELYTKAPKKALSLFQDKNGPFTYKDLYVFVISDKGVFKAHGQTPYLIGKSGYNMKDTRGNTFIQSFLKIKNRDWVTYRWPDNNDSGTVKEKRSYIIRIKDHILGVGYFTKPKTS